MPPRRKSWLSSPRCAFGIFFAIGSLAGYMSTRNKWTVSSFQSALGSEGTSASAAVSAAITYMDRGGKVAESVQGVRNAQAPAVSAAKPGADVSTTEKPAQLSSPPPPPPLPRPPPVTTTQPQRLAPAHTASARHVASRGHAGTVLYGIETCSSPWFEKIVQAQLDTWAMELPRNRLIFVGGKHDDAKEGLSQVGMMCDDKQGDLWCKEAVLLLRAIERAKVVPTKWVAVGQDDKYIWPQNVEKALAPYDSSKPQVFGSFGCGRAWEHTPGSKGGTVPRPAVYVNPQFSCKAVWEGGSLCGGGVYFVSKGALDLLQKPGQSWEAFIEEMRGISKGRGAASDVFASCLFWDRKVPMWSEQPVTSHTLTPRSGLDKFPLTMHLDIKKEWIPGYIYALSNSTYNIPPADTPGYKTGR